MTEDVSEAAAPVPAALAVRREAPDRNLALELVRVTEAAALAVAGGPPPPPRGPGRGGGSPGGRVGPPPAGWDAATRTAAMARP